MIVRILGAGGGEMVTVHGPDAGPIVLGKGQVQGLYEAPADTTWDAPRQKRGDKYRGIEYPGRDMTLGFHVMGGGESWAENHSRLRNLFTYHLDPWWSGDTLATIEVETEDYGVRSLQVQMTDEPEFSPDIDPEKNGYGNVIYSLRAAEPFWSSPTWASAWETGSSSGSGVVWVHNPTPLPVYQKFVVTPGKWVLPDVAWKGAPGKREPADSRSITLQEVTTSMGGLVVDLDPMHVMMQSDNGINVMGMVGGGYYFMHEIPPYTPKQKLPVSVTDAPSSGARCELHQPRLWPSFMGGYR